MTFKKPKERWVIRRKGRSRELEERSKMGFQDSLVVDGEVVDVGELEMKSWRKMKLRFGSSSVDDMKIALTWMKS